MSMPSRQAICLTMALSAFVLCVAREGACQAPTGMRAAGSVNVPTLEEIVSAYAKYQDRLLRFTETYEFQEIVDNPRDPESRRGTMFVEGEYAYDGTCYLWEHTWWYEPPAATATRENPSFDRTIWDGTSVWTYLARIAPKPDGSPRGSLRVTPNVRACPKSAPYFFENPRYNFTIRNYEGREALGFLLFWSAHDPRRVDEILTDAATVRVRPNTEEVDGASCYVVDVDLPKGILSVWFDPARQYSIPLAVWQYRPGSGEEHPEWRILKFEAVYRVRDYVQTKDLWAPKETSLEWHIQYANGENEERLYRFRRLTFEVDPDFAARNLFTLAGTVEEGAKVRESACAGPDPNTGEHRDLYVREYFWRNGTMVLDKDHGGAKTPLLTGFP